MDAPYYNDGIHEVLRLGLHLVSLAGQPGTPLGGRGPLFFQKKIFLNKKKEK